MIQMFLISDEFDKWDVDAQSKQFYIINEITTTTKNPLFISLSRQCNGILCVLGSMMEYKIFCFLYLIQIESRFLFDDDDDVGAVSTILCVF